MTTIYRLDEAVALLERTPGVLRVMLKGLPAAWVEANEGAGTWTPYDVVGHLIHGERTDWMPRVRHLLTHGDAQPFPPFDRDAMFRESSGRTLDELLDTLADLRRGSLAELAGLALTDADLDRRGRHPALGEVTLRQHLATWVAHDLTHVHQVVRTLARRYDREVGPWRAYLSILRDVRPT
jgi:hypothetical protein